MERKLAIITGAEGGMGKRSPVPWLVKVNAVILVLLFDDEGGTQIAGELAKETEIKLCKCGR